MEDTNFNDTLLTVLRNIELNTAQQSSTPQNVDIIQPLTMKVIGRTDIFGVTLPTTTALRDAIRPETFYFPIPAETPYLIIPETKRSLAFYRDNEPIPFGFVNAGEINSFRLPHLQQLRVDVLPSATDATITLYASSRPYETPNRLRASCYYNLFPKQVVTAGNVYTSPVISTVDNLDIAYHMENGTVDAGITKVDFFPYYINERAVNDNETQLQTFGPTSPSVSKAVPLTSDRMFITQPPRYMFFQIQVSGAGNIADFFVDYAFVPR